MGINDDYTNRNPTYSPSEGAPETADSVRTGPTQQGQPGTEIQSSETVQGNGGAPTPDQVEQLLDQASSDGEQDGRISEEQDEAKSQLLPEQLKFVRNFMERRNIEILFDGSLRCVSAPRVATNPDEVDAILAVEQIDEFWLIDELMLEIAAQKSRVSQGEIKRAVRKVTREDRLARRRAVVLPLLVPISETERAMAATAWLRLTTAVFEAESSLAAACLAHFVWQVKQKLLGRPVKHHLMPVIWSPIQGSGKTTFILDFLSPLLELATGPVLISDFADKRSGDIYRFPALFVDDMEQIEPALIPVLKSLVTGEFLRRRKLGTSMSVGYQQRTTLIGTANSPIDSLVADRTGNRRFISLLFRNGAVSKGGDEGVWSAVGEADYLLLWQSVDAFDKSPIEDYLEALVTAQGSGPASDNLENWLCELDLDASEVKVMIERYGVPCKELYDLSVNRPAV